MKKILIIDAQGGGIGKQLITEIEKKALEVEIIAVGTNAAATAQMIKAGNVTAATGENPVIVCSRDADFIMGPVGIAIADSMLGEITPAMATAVGQSAAKKILIPMNNCGNYIVGTKSQNIKALVEEAVEYLKSYL